MQQEQTQSELKERIDTLLGELGTPTAPLEDSEPIDAQFSEPVEVEGEVYEKPVGRGIRARWLIPIGLVALLLSLLGALLLLPVVSPTATVLITPDQQTVSASGMLVLHGRSVLSRNLTLSEQIKTSGVAHQNAQVSSGTITFFNALTAEQTVGKGTLLTGADGVQVVTDAPAFIPAGSMAVNGQVSVPAHSLLSGPGANIAAGDISGPCCLPYVFARSSAFHGGQSARDYPTPTSADIRSATESLTHLLSTSISTEATSQLVPGEVLAPPQCQSKAVSSQLPGTEAAQITVTLSSSCTALAYTQSDLAAREQNLLEQAVAQQLGSGYVLSGGTHQTITQASTDAAMLTLHVQVSGLAVYHFSHQELTRMQTLIAGKNSLTATALLLHTRGVRTVGIQDKVQDRLPDNPQDIALAVFNQ